MVCDPATTIAAWGDRDDGPETRRLKGERIPMIPAGFLAEQDAAMRNRHRSPSTDPAPAEPPVDPRKPIVACVLDGPRWEAMWGEVLHLLPLTRDNLEFVMQARHLDAILLQTSWQSSPLVDPGFRDRLVELARARAIPIIFHDKEGAYWTSRNRFLDHARGAELIVTCDDQAVAHWQARWPEADVYALPFACSPRLHHPVREGALTDRIAYGGSFYPHHEEERRLEGLLAGLALKGELDIYARRNRRESFPENLRSSIRDGLPYEKWLDEAKRYAIHFSTSSTPDSATMFSIRSIELAAMGCYQINRWTLSLRALFPELPLVDSVEGLNAELDRALADPLYRWWVATMARVRTLLHHTWAHRWAFICSRVQLRPPTLYPRITVLAPTCRPRYWRNLLAGFLRQDWPNKQLVVLVERELYSAAVRYFGGDAEVIDTGAAPLGSMLNRGLSFGDGDLFAKIDDDVLYHPYHLGSLYGTQLQTGADLVTRLPYFVYVQDLDEFRIIQSDRDSIGATTWGSGADMLWTKALAERIRFRPHRCGEDSSLMKDVLTHGGKIVSDPPFCSLNIRRSGGEGHTWKPDKGHFHRELTSRVPHSHECLRWFRSQLGGLHAE